MSKSQPALKDMHIPPSVYVNARSTSEQHDTTTKDLLNQSLLKVRPALLSVYLHPFLK